MSDSESMMEDYGPRLEADMRPLDSLQHRFTIQTQTLSSRFKVFQLVQSWIDEIELTIERMDELDGDNAGVQHLLRTEAKTWDLLMRLYFFRLETQDKLDELDLLIEHEDEKAGVDYIQENCSELREINIILSWLETNYEKENPSPDLTPRFVSWEQTLEALKRDGRLNSRFNDNMVAHMDPDVCLRERKSLHILDLDEESKLHRSAFHYIRCGQLNKATKHLNDSGHIAKGCTLSGASFTERVETDAGRRIMGNIQRDLWKKVAYQICSSGKLNDFENGCLASLCGHRASLLKVASCWDDELWSYLKTERDLRVEKQLRKFSNYTFTPMSDEYWNQGMSIEGVLARLKPDFSNDYSYLFHVVNESFIKGDIEGLNEFMAGFLKSFYRSPENQMIKGQISRFTTHIYFIFGLIDLPFNQDLMDACTIQYIKTLTASNQLIYTPFYISYISKQVQIPTILNQLRQTTSLNDIKIFIKSAFKNGLNVLEISDSIVKKLFEDPDFDINNLNWILECLEYWEKSDVMLCLLKNVLMICRRFLIGSKMDIVARVADMIDSTCIKVVTSISTNYEETIVKEFICYRALIDSHKALTAYNKCKTQEPTRPKSEQKSTEYSILLKKYKETSRFYLNSAIDSFFKVIKFPNGFLLDCVDPEDMDELTAVSSVRRVIIPKIIHILLKLIQETNSGDHMRPLLYTICEDHRQILKEFSSEALSIIFKGVEESTRV